MSKGCSMSSMPLNVSGCKSNVEVIERQSLVASLMRTSSAIGLARRIDQDGGPAELDEPGDRPHRLDFGVGAGKHVLERNSSPARPTHWSAISTPPVPWPSGRQEFLGFSRAPSACGDRSGGGRPSSRAGRTAAKRVSPTASCSPVVGKLWTQDQSDASVVGRLGRGPARPISRRDRPSSDRGGWSCRDRQRRRQRPEGDGARHRRIAVGSRSRRTRRRRRPGTRRAGHRRGRAMPVRVGSGGLQYRAADCLFVRAGGPALRPARRRHAPEAGEQRLLPGLVETAEGRLEQMRRSSPRPAPAGPVIVGHLQLLAIRRSSRPRAA